MNLLDSVLLEQFTHEGLLRASSLLPVLCEPAIAVTGTATATIDRMHLCSGTSADYTVTLPPAASNAGHYIGFRMASALTKMVTLDGDSAETIDDVTTRKMWSGEIAVLFCDGTGWFKILGKSRPMIAKASMATAVSAVTSANTKLPVTGTIYDNNGLINTGSGRIDIKRYGVYLFNGGMGQNNDITQISPLYMQIFVNGSTYLQASFYKEASQAYPAFYISGDTVLSVGDYVELYVGNYSGATKDFDGKLLSVVEVPSW